MSTIKISELATSAISLTDFFAKADSAGLANKNTTQGLSNFLNTVGTLAYRGVLLAADGAVTLDGIYVAGDDGTYTNNGGLVITLNGQVVLISITESQTVFEKVEMPVGVIKDTVLIDGSTNVPTTGTVKSYIDVRDYQLFLDKIKYYDEVNYLDVSNVNYEGGKFLLIDGNLVGNPAYNTSGFIPVSDGDIFFVPQEATGGVAICFYDSSNVLLDSYTTNNKRYAYKNDVENSAFIRISVRAEHSYIYKVGEVLINKTSNKIDNISLNNLIDFKDPYYEEGKFISTANGNLNTNANYNTTPFIDLKDLTEEVLSGFYIKDNNPYPARSPFRFVVYYDSLYNFIEGDIVDVDTQSYKIRDVTNALYIRISYTKSNNKDFIICKDENYYKGQVFEEIRTRKSVPNIEPVAYSIIGNNYYSDAGIVSSTFYDYAEFDVLQNKLYYIRSSQVASYSDFNHLTVLDIDNNVIYSNKDNGLYKGFLMPRNAVKAIVSYRNTYVPIIMVEGKHSEKNYEFSGSLTNGVRQNIGDVSFIKKNIGISLYLTFSSFSSIILAKGFTSYHNVKLTLNGTSFSTVLSQDPSENYTENHGLTFVDYLFATIETNNLNQAILKLKTNGGTFESQPFLFYGDDNVNITPQMNCELVKGTVSFKDVNKLVRCYADSYGGTFQLNRWPYQSAKLGADYLVDNLSGGTSLGMFPEVVKDFRYGIPKIIFWCLGMNDGSDTDINTPTSVWKQTYLNLQAVCDLLDIELVLATTPNVPTISHIGKNKYIEDSGNRYADFNAVVSNGLNSNWKTGMLEDGIHPSETGAIVLAIEALSALPEIFN